MATRLRLVIPGFDQARALGHPNMAALLGGGDVQPIEQSMGSVPDPADFDWYATDFLFARLDGLPNWPQILEAWGPAIATLMGAITGLHMNFARSKKPDFTAHFESFGQVALKLANFEQPTAEVYKALDDLVGFVKPEKCLLIVPAVEIPVQNPDDYGRGNSGGIWYTRAMDDGFALRRCDLGGIPYYVRGLGVEIAGVSYEELLRAQTKAGKRKKKPPKQSAPPAALVLRISDEVPHDRSGIYACSTCGNRITGVAGKNMPPCSKCDEDGINWLLIRDTDEGEPASEGDA